MAPRTDALRGDGPARLLVVAPLRLEREALRGRLPGALVVRSGMGAARATRAALHVARIPFEAFAVAGFCGATAEGLCPGDVVVAAEVRGPHGVYGCETARMLAALEATGIAHVHVGPLTGADHVVHGAERRALAAEGALAADMESAWLAPAAAGRPFAVVRVVLDTPADRLSRPLALASGAIAARRTLRRLAPALPLWARAVVRGDERAMLCCRQGEGLGVLP
jgi:4-hydroxy-3-methylbut-2-enyl diphosphate reductase